MISKNKVLPLDTLTEEVYSLGWLKIKHESNVLGVVNNLINFLLSATLTASCSGTSAFFPLFARSGTDSNFCSYHFESEENDTIISIEFKLSTNKNLGDFSSINGGACWSVVFSFFFSSFGCCGITCFKLENN